MQQPTQTPTERICNVLQYELNLANDRLSHTIYMLSLTPLPDDDDENGNEETGTDHTHCVQVVLHSDDDSEPQYHALCQDAETATRALWLLCGLAMWLFAAETVHPEILSEPDEDPPAN